jgi:hypothetical protein
MASKSRQWAAKLRYPEGFETVPESEVNGVGPKNFGWLVSDFIFGIDIREAARIHDAYWYLKKQHEGNKAFLKNMKIQISHDISAWKRSGANIMACAYFALVKLGGPLFFKD